MTKQLNCCNLTVTIYTIFHTLNNLIDIRSQVKCYRGSRVFNIINYGILAVSASHVTTVQRLC